MAFDKLTQQLQDALKKRGFETATIPQELGIPQILSGKNVLVLAETGSGKTESVILPVFDMWLRRKENLQPINILYITPLKSLNRDLLKRLLWWGNELGINISVRHGDTPQYERKKQVDFPDDMLISTPETLQAILPAKKMKENLRNIKWVIIDEVHEIVTSKRGVQLAVGLERLRKLCGDFQLIALSATVGSPECVADFISGGREMKIIKANTEKKFDIKVLSPDINDVDYSTAEKYFISPDVAARLRAVHELIKSHDATLTFTNTRDFAEVLTSRIRQVYPETPVENHHSSLSKNVRIEVEEKFRNQEIKSIICTSSLELGIDIGTIDFVIQYMSPRQVSKIIQRVGRAGHSIKKKSEGVIIATEIDDIFESAVIAKQALTANIEPIKIHENALDVLANQIIGLSRDELYSKEEEMYELIKKAYPYKNLSKEQFIEVCKQLEGNRFIFFDSGKIKGSKKGLVFYFTNLSTIPDTKNYAVINSISNQKVGTLDEEFVALHGISGASFVMKGEIWKIISIENDKIYVEPSGELDATIPGWEGDLMPVPYQVAQEVGKIRKIISENLENGEEVILSKYPVDSSSAKKMAVIIRNQSKHGFIPTNENVVIERQAETVVIHTCLGTKGNETLGRYLSAALAERVGSFRLKTDPYRIVLQGQIINQKLLEDLFFKEADITFFLEKNLSESQLFQWRFINIAKKFGIIRKDAEYGRVKLSKIIDLYYDTPVWRETLREIYTDKLDVDITIEFLDKIRKKKIPLIFKDTLSPLGQIGIDEKSELVGSGKPDLQILEIFKNRLNEKDVRLVCLNCGEWSQVYTIKDVPEEIRCHKCHAKLIGVAGRTEIGVQNIVKKKLSGKTLSQEEEIRYKRLVESSDIVISYGKKALIALAARGVGVSTAKRVLKASYFNEENFLKILLEAERTYIKNKKYWG